MGKIDKKKEIWRTKLKLIPNLKENTFARSLKKEFKHS